MNEPRCGRTGPGAGPRTALAVALALSCGAATADPPGLSYELGGSAATADPPGLSYELGGSAATADPPGLSYKLDGSAATADPPGLSYKLGGSAAAQTLTFFHDGVDARQQRGTTLAISVEPEFYAEWAGGKQSVTFTPFVRLDERDEERSHADLRELYWRKAGQAYELRLGVRRVFWGVTESQHLVDVINQDDFVENFDGEDKLGQPMANLALITADWGTFDIFVLPYFRERTFPGVEGRLRPQPWVDTDDARYESDRKEHHVDGALRWFGTVGAFDIGLSYFRGTNRDPRLLVEPGPLQARLPQGCPPGCQPLLHFPQARLVPQYDQITQLGLDLQANVNGWALKLEGIRRVSDFEQFTAAVGGFEYTLVGVFGTTIDVGMLAEYLYDSRGELAPDSLQALAQQRIQDGAGFTPAEAMALRGLRPKNYSAFQDDVFVGSRIAFNDVHSTDILAGLIVSPTRCSAASRRGGVWATAGSCRWNRASSRIPSHRTPCTASGRMTTCSWNWPTISNAKGCAVCCPLSARHLASLSAAVKSQISPPRIALGQPADHQVAVEANRRRRSFRHFRP